ncbi:MAG: nitroreductase family protein [Chloroflexi bacterium]|nr:nitroreductase family protein [Chloroflexota bacterium]
MNEAFLQVIRSRRVTRNMTDQPVAREQLEKILEAARWAPVAGNQRSNRLVAIQSTETIKLLKMFAPGMYQYPQALILICIDENVVNENGFPATDMSPFIDVGAVMQTILLSAHAIGLGAGPVTSFSKEAVRVILNLPRHLHPVMFICIGYASSPSESQLPMRPRKKITWRDLVDWERFE